MKKIILSLALVMGSLLCSAKSDVANDTIRVENSRLLKVVTDETTNSKGAKVTKYYFLYDGFLVPTTKKVAEAYNLCAKHGAKCSLSMVINRKSGKRRIITNM